MEHLCTLGVKMALKCSWSAHKRLVLKIKSLLSTPCTPVHSDVVLGHFFHFFLKMCTFCHEHSESVHTMFLLGTLLLPGPRWYRKGSRSKLLLASRRSDDA